MLDKIAGGRVEINLEDYVQCINIETWSIHSAKLRHIGVRTYSYPQDLLFSTNSG